MPSFADELYDRVRRQIAIAHDPRNLVDETAGETLVGDPVLTTSGRPIRHAETGEVLWETPPRLGWAPPPANPDADPADWVEADLYPRLRLKAHQAGWESPVAIVYHLVRVQRASTPDPVVLRVMTIQFDVRARLLPAQLKAREPLLQEMAAGLGRPYFEGTQHLGWSSDCGDPVPVVSHGGASAGNVAWRTPVILRLVADHNDPDGAVIIAAAQEARPSIT